MSALRLAALADLAEQLRYAPKSTAMRQLDHAVELSRVLDAARNYPEDWVIERITGYRPDLDAPATLVGAALLGELSAFVERVSEGAGLAPDDLPDGSVPIGALAARWGVSRRTVERYRRQGLVAHRVRDERNQALLLVTPDAADAFGAVRHDALHRAGAFSRLDGEAEQRVARLGTRAARRFGWSLAETARRLAARTGRQPATVRRALLRSSVSAGLFDAAPERLSARDREIVLRADARGVPVRRIAERFDRTPASVRRLALEIRAERLRALSLPGDGAESSALKETAVCTGLLVVPDRTLEALMTGAGGDGPIDADLEKALARAHVATLARAGTVARDLPRAAPPAALVDRAETDLRWAALLRGRLVHMQRRTIVQAMGDALGRGLDTFSPAHARALHALAIDAAIDAVAGFDPARGGRLAAPIVVAVQRALAGRAPASPATGARAAARSVRLRDWTPHVSPWRRWLDLPRSARERVDRLTPEARDLVTRRFSLDGEAPRTLAEIAELTGVAPHALSRRERSALRALRQAGPA